MLCSAARRRFRWIPLRDRQRHLFRAERTEEICALCERGLDVLLFWIYDFVIRLATGMFSREWALMPGCQAGSTNIGVPLAYLNRTRCEISTPANTAPSIRRISRPAQVSHQKTGPRKALHHPRGPDFIACRYETNGTTSRTNAYTSIVPQLASSSSVFNPTYHPGSVHNFTFRGSIWNARAQMVLP